MEGNKAFYNDGELGKITQMQKRGEPPVQIGWSWTISAEVVLQEDGSLEIDAENDQDYCGISYTGVVIPGWVLRKLMGHRLLNMLGGPA